MPCVAIVLYLLFVFIPVIDPLKKNIEKFREHYDRVVVLTISFLLYLYLLTIIWNTGVQFSMIQFLAPAFGILFYCYGVLSEKTKRNWFVGVVTPWTLSSDKVWQKTNETAGRLFKNAGLIAFLGFFLQDYAAFFVLAPVVIVTVYTVVYSYAEYRKETK